jgi:pimeloyl-ACP methyl ester carboxylesterase
VIGTRDPDYPDAVVEARWLEEAMGAEVLMVEGAGHYPHTEMLDQVSPKVLALIDGLYARQPKRFTAPATDPN